MSIRTGDYFGAKNELGSWLYCKATRVYGNSVIARVINGAWPIRFDLATGICTGMKFQDHSAAIWEPMDNPPHIAFTGVLPKGIGDDYNEAIEYMREQYRAQR